MIRTPHRLMSFFCALVLLGHLLLAGATPAFAQFFDESLEQEDLFVEEDAAFAEDSGAQDFGQPTSPEQDFTESNRFVDESLLPSGGPGTTVGGRQLQLTLGRDRETLPLNVAWGAGTGLLIGGWFALINEGDNRQTQRSIGLGIVAGILLGIAVGTRTVLDPNAPRPTSVGDAAPTSADGPQFSPAVALEPDGTRVGFRMTF